MLTFGVLSCWRKCNPARKEVRLHLAYRKRPHFFRFLSFFLSLSQFVLFAIYSSLWSTFVNKNAFVLYRFPSPFKSHKRDEILEASITGRNAHFFVVYSQFCGNKHYNYRTRSGIFACVCCHLKTVVCSVKNISCK